MAIKSDNEIDRELTKIKSQLEGLKKTQTIFSNTFKNLPPKERALTIQKIHADQRAIASFIEKSKNAEIFNSGTKFGIETVKQSYLSLMGFWKKLEKQLEGDTF